MGVPAVPKVAAGNRSAAGVLIGEEVEELGFVMWPSDRPGHVSSVRWGWCLDV